MEGTIYSEETREDGTVVYSNKLDIKYNLYKYCIHPSKIGGVFPFKICHQCPHLMWDDDYGESYCGKIFERVREINEEAHAEVESKMGDQYAH